MIQALFHRAIKVELLHCVIQEEITLLGYNITITQLGEEKKRRMERRLLEGSLFLNMLGCLFLLFSTKSLEAYRVGYWLTDVKLRNYGIDAFIESCRLAGMELVRLDLNQNLESQGPFDAILHDVNDLITQEDFDTSQRQTRELLEYSLRHPETLMLDSLVRIGNIQQRLALFQLIKNTTDTLDSSFDVPSFVELPTIDEEVNRRILQHSQLKYPFVCKPSIAHGTKFCHKMQVIFNDEGLRDVRAPCVAQTFIDHGAILYKVYVIDGAFTVVERPSLKNLTDTTATSGDVRTIYFHTHTVSKPHSDSYLNEMNVGLYNTPQPDHARLSTLVQALQTHLGLALFGFDIIIEKNTNKYFVIDINPFPSYEGFPNFNEQLQQLLLKTVLSRHKKPS